MGQSSVWGVLVTLGIQETMLSGAAGCARLEGLAGYPQTALGKEPQPPALLTLKHGMETGKPCHCHFKSPEEGGPSPTAHHTEVSERRKWGRVWRTPSPAAPPACSHLQTSCNETGNRCRPHHHSPQSLGQRGAMDRPRALLLLLALLTLCITAGTPKVWVQVQTEAAKSPSFTVRCGFLGSGSISLVTVSCGKPDGAEGASLAVLHPEFGTELKAPARQAHWETKTSISLTLEGSEGRSPSPNTTFCCKFVSFPEGSQAACGNPSLSTDQAPVVRADLAGIWGVSGVLLFGCFYLLHLLRRQRHWSVMKLQPPLSSPQTQMPARAAGPASLASLHIPYATVNTSYFCPATLDTVLPPQPLSRWAQLPTHRTRQPQAPAPWASLPASARSSFISVENGLYTQAGERPPHAGPNLTPFPDPLGPRAVEGRLGVR
ncbi:transmembrane protein PVRIG isoform X2 [Equus asinus]|uniref:transmembrane protein PVRIG isoform X2 n=1 Tax=Equus asinus TaxID=9793 RepID=UPI001D042A62|nr:transmembrane protein PVRIG isoform X2 [Equus asinus]